MAEPPPTSTPLEDRRMRWERTGDPRHLWPDVPESDLMAEHRAIWRAASAVLAGEAAPHVAPASTPDARILGIAAFRAGMGPLLGWWIARGTVSADPPAATLLRTHLEHGRRRAATFESALSALLPALAARGIEPTVLKGTHTGVTHFEDPACRAGADIDLLVRPAAFHAAREALAAAGYRERYRSRAPVRSVWYPPTVPPLASLEMNHADNPWSIDLHCTLERRYFRGLSVSLDTASLLLVPLTIGGHPATGLGSPHLAVYLALHGSRELSFPQLIRVVELVLVLRRASMAPGFWERVAAFLADHRLHRFVCPMFVLAERLAPGTVGQPLLGACTAALSPRWRRWLDYLLAHGLSRPHRRTLAERVVWATGTTDLLRIASDLVWHGEGIPLRDRARLWREAIRTLRGVGTTP